ncbi:MAG: ADP-forming succinate--CoA ligase subunit beta [Dehalococcoidia bacterium]|jgi:succinyl-CoA synthetase beta subunit|nr:MAG: succinyl-CoA synthetase beta subunit [Chloroflexota bacterium]|tara:strand:- start:987 stop:2150 length:1164 start_codon:yes stop_codon:yes gene_type:complete
MKLHEYQAKNLLKKFNVPVPDSNLISNLEEITTIQNNLIFPIVVKSQVHSGARGKAGGIKIANNINEMTKYATDLLGKQLITHQTGEKGLPINSVLLEEGINIEKEYYLALTIDGSVSKPIIISSPQGGMDIEAVAEKNPEEILKTEIHPVAGLLPFQSRNIGFQLNLDKALFAQLHEILTGIYEAFVDSDATLIEINPLVLTKENQLIAADTKFSIDDSAMFRQKDLFNIRDKSQEDSLELEAEDQGIQNYIKLDGNIGCLVNGAGLAMATMDAIKFAGGSPANFLDIGTANNPESVVSALQIIGSDPDVKAIFINIFGGLAKTDIIAEGFVKAKEQGLIQQPTVIRLAGTNVEDGKRILEESGIDFQLADGFAQGANLAVTASIK